MKITPNGGNNPCVCGYIHPCCRYLVDSGCPHLMPGDHKHAPDRPIISTAEAVAKVHYDAYEWSGCDGSRWERVPTEAQKRFIREAAEWIACVRQAHAV